MQNKVKKIMAILLCAVLVFSIGYTTLASSNANFKLDQFTDNKSKAPSEVTGLAKDTIGAAIAVFRIVASGTLIIIAIAISIKYMLSSAGDRADIKKHAVAFVIAALIIFGSTTIIEVLFEISGEITKTN